MCIQVPCVYLLSAASTVIRNRNGCPLCKDTNSPPLQSHDACQLPVFQATDPPTIPHFRRFSAVSPHPFAHLWPTFNEQKMTLAPQNSSWFNTFTKYTHTTHKYVGIYTYAYVVYAKKVQYFQEWAAAKRRKNLDRHWLYLPPVVTLIPTVIEFFVSVICPWIHGYLWCLWLLRLQNLVRYRHRRTKVKV